MSSPIPTNPVPTVPIELPPVVLHSCACLGCGYDLQGLASSGVCPECRAPVLRSLGANLLQYSSLDFLKSLKQGCALLVCSFGATIASSLFAIGLDLITGSLFGSARSVAFINVGLTSLSSLMCGLGWWILSSPDPGLFGEDPANKARKSLRVVVVVSLLASIGLSVLSLHPSFAGGPNRWLFGVPAAGFTPVTPATNAGIFGPASLFWPVLWGVYMAFYLVLGALSIYTAMRYLVDVVRRMPDPVLETRINRFKRQGPWLVSLGILLIGLGPLIAFIENWIIIHKVWRRVSDIAQNHVDAVPLRS